MIQPRPVLLQPEYASPQTRHPTSRRAVHVAIFCGAAPLILGIVIFLCWAITRDQDLEFLGFFDILFGLVCTLIGAVAVIVQFYRIPGEDMVFFRRFVSETWIAVLLLAINFPTCWIILRGVDYINAKFPHPVSNSGQSN
jgi:hypothetical protein